MNIVTLSVDIAAGIPEAFVHGYSVYHSKAGLLRPSLAMLLEGTISVRTILIVPTRGKDSQ